MEIAIDLEQQVEEQENRRDLEFAKKQDSAKSAPADRAMDEFKKAAKEATKRATLRVINIAFAATIVAAIASYLIMTFQAFVGNLGGVKSVALSPMELGIWFTVSAIVLLSVIAIVSLLALLSLPITDPVLAAKIIFQIVIDLFK